MEGINLFSSSSFHWALLLWKIFFYFFVGKDCCWFCCLLLPVTRPCRVGWSIDPSIHPSVGPPHFWIVSVFCITATAQLSATLVLCIRLFKEAFVRFAEGFSIIRLLKCDLSIHYIRLSAKIEIRIIRQSESVPSSYFTEYCLCGH